MNEIEAKCDIQESKNNSKNKKEKDTRIKRGREISSSQGVPSHRTPAQ